MDKTKKRRIQILAASVFWLGVWQAAAMAIGQEVFLVSPIQAAGTLMELLPQADFWQRVGFSAGHILLGFALGVVVSVLLAGCNALPGENLQVEELLRAPRLSGDYGAVQTALNDWLGESAQLKYPMQGELLSPFLLQDLDGDGQQDAAVLYTTAQSTNVCIAILQRDDTGAWQVRQSVEGLADTVENVRLAQLRAGDDCQLVVGYVAAQGDHYLAVYAYNDGQLSTILEQSYEQYLVEDITGGGSQDLILMSTQEDGGVQIELLTVDKEGGFRQAAVICLLYTSDAADE